LGQQQPVVVILAQRPLPGVKRSLINEKRHYR